MDHKTPRNARCVVLRNSGRWLFAGSNNSLPEPIFRICRERRFALIRHTYPSDHSQFPELPAQCEVVGAIRGIGDGVAAPFPVNRLAPHCTQKLFSAATAFPQLGQVRGRAVPHLPQNLLSSAAIALQVGHCTGLPPRVLLRQTNTSRSQRKMAHTTPQEQSSPRTTP